PRPRRCGRPGSWIARPGNHRPEHWGGSTDMGQRLTRRFLLGALALAALAGAGCDRKAAQFNNTLTEYNRQLFDAGRKLGESMAPAVQGQPVNATQVRDAYDEVVSTLDAIKKDFATLPVPPSASGKRFAAGYAKFLK